MVVVRIMVFIEIHTTGVVLEKFVFNLEIFTR